MSTVVGEEGVRGASPEVVWVSAVVVEEGAEGTSLEAVCVVSGALGGAAGALQARVAVPRTAARSKSRDTELRGNLAISILFP